MGSTRETPRSFTAPTTLRTKSCRAKFSARDLPPYASRGLYGSFTAVGWFRRRALITALAPWSWLGDWARTLSWTSLVTGRSETGLPTAPHAYLAFVFSVGRHMAPISCGGWALTTRCCSPRLPKIQRG